MKRTRVAYAADAMALPDEYERQQRWRRFGDALTHVPLVRGQRVLDVGCGVGSASVLLARAGADVVGVDVDDALLLRARELHPALRFEKHDVGELDASTLGRVDGIWASFVAAYFPDLSPFVTRLRELLVDEGWIALVEIDDLLGHEPRAASLAADIAGFYAWARAQGGYGFLHGRALAPALRDAGFELVYEGILDDGELAFRGPAPADVLDAWRSRFGTPRRLQAACEKVARGSFDFVLSATGFQYHNVDEMLTKAARSAGVVPVRVNRGRPVTCVRAIARELGLDRSPRAAVRERAHSDG